MNRTTVVLSGLLAVSVVMNIAFLVRGREEPSGPAARTVQPLRQDPARTDPLPAAPSTPRIERSVAPGPLPEARSSAPPAVVLPSRVDPRVARIIDEEEEFRIFWQDLGRVFGVRGKLDPEEFNRVILTSTADFLRLREPARTQFVGEARVAVAERILARKEYEDQKRAILPKGTPSYDAARKQVDTTYQLKLKVSEDRVGALLDPTPGRHQEFAAKLQHWLKELEPLTP